MKVEFELTIDMMKNAARKLTLAEILDVAFELSVKENKHEMLPILMDLIIKSKEK